MSWLYGMLGSAAIAAILATGATYYVVSDHYKVEITDLNRQIEKKRADDAEASLKKLNGFIATMHFASEDYSKTSDQLSGKLDLIVQAFRNATRATPLPPDCKPDVVRQRSLSAAVAAADAAASGLALGSAVRPAQ